MYHTALAGESGDDQSSSDGSVIRVPIRGGEEAEEEDEEDDGYSSSGSVIRVNANEDACSPDDSGLRTTTGASNVDEEEGYSSDGSVVRVPAGKAGAADDDAEGTPRKPAGELEKGPTDGNIDGKSGQPAHMKLNLLAASKYFGSKGGVSDVAAGAEAQRNGPGQVSAKAGDNPQVRFDGGISFSSSSSSTYARACFLFLLMNLTAPFFLFLIIYDIASATALFVNLFCFLRPPLFLFFLRLKCCWTN